MSGASSYCPHARRNRIAGPSRESVLPDLDSIFLLALVCPSPPKDAAPFFLRRRPFYPNLYPTK